MKNGKKAKSKNGFLNIVILAGVAIAAVLLGVSGYSVWKNFANTHPTPVAWNINAVQLTTPISTDTINRIGASLTLDTSDWKTYRNEKYGFEVRYPGSWEVSEDNNKMSVRFWNEGVETWEWLDIAVYVPTDEVSASAIEGDEVIISHSTTTIGGISAKRIVWGERGRATGIHILVARQPFAISIWLDATPHPVTDQILSTFKFLN